MISSFFQDVNILRKKDEKLVVNVKKLVSLQHTLEIPNSINYGYTRGIGKPLVYYLCAGIPLYKSPDKQESAGYTHVNLRYFSRIDRKITTELRSYYIKKKRFNSSCNR